MYLYLLQQDKGVGKVDVLCTEQGGGEMIFPAVNFSTEEGEIKLEAIVGN